VNDVVYALNQVPAWLPLGPEIDYEGLPAREVLGDWSHLAECDRPPKYIRKSDGHNSHVGWDTSETRKAINQTCKGKPISELKGIHSGKVAILFNGETLGHHDLHRIKYPIIGMNRTHVGFPGYNGPQPDYLAIIDWAWLDKPHWRKSILTHPRIVNGSNHKDEIGYRATRHPRMAPFSFDLERDGFAGPVPCSTGHLALQLAVYMGFTELYCIGWDLSGGHFDGTKASLHYAEAIRYHKRQAELLNERGIKVYVCGSPNSKVDFFPHASFEAVCH
jgi:hypothetical protein